MDPGRDQESADSVDGQESGSDAGAVGCKTTTKTTSGPQTYSAQPHTYTQAGKYTFHYQVRYCGKNGWIPVSKSATVTIK
jgi:hypothetical protein